MAETEKPEVEETEPKSDKPKYGKKMAAKYATSACRSH